MKSHRLQLGVLLLAVASLAIYGALPAAAAAGPPNAPTAIHAFALDGAAIVSWPAASVPVTTPASGAVDSYQVNISPPCGGCGGTTPSGTSTRITGLSNLQPYTFTVQAHNAQGFSVPGPSSVAVTPEVDATSGCQFDSFPAIPGSSSELAVACTLSTAIGGAGNHYNIEDFPQAQWHSGAGRSVLTTAATASTSATITAAAAHFAAQDVNDTISGPGIPSNSFVKTVSSASAVILNQVVGLPGVASGATLTLNNSDGRTFTDAKYPTTKVSGGSTTATVGTSTATAVTNHITTAIANIVTPPVTTLHVASTANFNPAGTIPATGTLSIPTTSPTGTAKFTYTGKTATTFTGVSRKSGTGTIGVNAVVTEVIDVTATSYGNSTGILQVAVNTSFNPAGGTINVTTSAGTAVMTYTAKSGSTLLTGVNKTSGTGTVAAAAAIKEPTPDVTTATSLRVMSTATLTGTGDISVDTSAGGAVLSYSGTTATSFTGLTLLAGSGTVANAAGVHQATDVTALSGSTVTVTSTTGPPAFPSSGTVSVATTTGTAQLTYTGTSGTSLTGATFVADSGNGYLTATSLATNGSVVNGGGLTTITSAGAHFCTIGLTGCNSLATQKDDNGRGISGTVIPHGDTITGVTATTITIGPDPTLPCPADVTTCGQLGISSLPTLTTTRQVQDATYASTNKVCSATAAFDQTDVDLPIANVGAGRIPAAHYIIGVNVTGCPGGTTEATINGAFVGVSANALVVIGSPANDAPKNGDAVMSLSSALSVSPTLAPGTPDCSADSAVGSNLAGKWLNPGSFDGQSLGHLPNTAVTGPVIGQLDVVTGTGSPAFAGYAVLANSTNSPGDTDSAPHVDVVFPSLLTGIAVCPAPNNVGVATVFRFFGETLSQSAAGTGQVRSFADTTSPSVTGDAHEHIITNPNASVFDATGSCTDGYPTSSAGYPCNGK